MGLSDKQFARLLEFRVSLRAFNRWSEDAAAAVGLSHAQHQLLVCVRGHPEPEGPTISDVAGYLMIRHHSAIGLINRAEGAGLVSRTSDAIDGRVIRLRLTDVGASRVEALTTVHLEELRRLAPALAALLGPE